MARVRGEEEAARSIIAEALKTEVQIHDTGASPSMYDLEISYADGSRAAAEVVAAADPESISLWRLINDSDKPWQVSGLVGGWSVSLDSRARGKRVIAELPELLRRLENQGIIDIRASVDATYDIAQGLHVVDAQQFETDFRGSIYVTISLDMERAGGAVSQTGNPLARWLGAILQEEGQEDVRRKLDASLLPERHAVVFFPAFSLAPFPVTDLLMREDAPLPEESPSLPREVTHVWAFSSWSSGDAFHWSPAGWRRFPKIWNQNSGS